LASSDGRASSIEAELYASVDVAVRRDVAISAKKEAKGPRRRLAGVLHADSRRDGNVLIGDGGLASREIEDLAIERSAVHVGVDGHSHTQFPRTVHSIELPLRLGPSPLHRFHPP